MSDLALGAEERGAALPLDADDRAPAAPARLTFVVVHLMVVLEAADHAEEVTVLLVGERRTAMLDGLVQRLDDRPLEAPHLLRGERFRGSVVAETGGKQDL